MYKIQGFSIKKIQNACNKILNIFLSHDCLRWKLLNPASEEHFQKLNNCKGRFTGDPAHEFECKTFKLMGEGEEEHLEEEVVSLKLF